MADPPAAAAPPPAPAPAPPPTKRRRAAAPRSPADCAICLDTMQAPVVTACGHSFCAACLAQYARYGRACPTCARPLPASAPYRNEALSALLALRAPARPAAPAPAPGAAGVEVEVGAEVGAEVALAFLARARRARRVARDAAERDLRAIEEDMGRVRAGAPGAGGVLGEELAEEVRMATGRGVKRGGGAEVYARAALVDRFYEDVQAMYFERRGRLGAAALAGVREVLVAATGLSRVGVRATVKDEGILGGVSRLVCAVEFGRGGEVVASAGITRRIKVFDVEALVGGGGECPVLEVAEDAKISSLAWRAGGGVLAAGLFDGGVSVHDTAVNARLFGLAEHDARVWAVDFCTREESLLLSASDDKTVRLWDVGRARRPTLSIPAAASVCSVRFNPYAAHELAFGCADHNVYSYDMRHPRAPVCVFEGHWRAVSYVLFLSRAELVSASTDSSCKLWNVQEQTPGLSYGGHVNERNFVGLCGNDDFFACGSEDNAVYVYHKGLTGPVLRHGMDAEGSFVSALAWKPDSNLIVAANNAGALQVLELG